MPERTTRQKDAEKSRVDWRKNYQRLEDNIPGLVFSMTFQPGRPCSFLHVSRDALELIGLSPEELLADAGLFQRLIHPADRERYERALLHNSISLSPWREELRLVVNGMVRWYDCMASPESLAEGGVCWHGLVFDITARKDAEKNHLRTNSLLDGIFNQNPFPIWISDRFGGLIRMNHACREIIGVVSHGPNGDYNILQDPRIREQGFLSLVRSVFDEGNTAQFLLACGDGEGGEGGGPGGPGPIFEVTVAPVRDEQGMVTNAIVMYNDITERLRAEADLRLSQFCIDHAGIAIFRIEEPDGRVAFVNEHACRSLGYSRRELTSMTVFDFDPTFTIERWREHRHNLKGKKRGLIETVHRRKDGSEFPVEVSISAFEYEGRTYSFSFAIDISERKAAEALRQSAENGAT